ncbi:hypothetical protein [Cellulophaga sp. Z1A5H]|uniref:hypothetical protein n=1 Tax=Cellulophaga sp. Z1A5H TaxID=2687291 RepID=UPI0013FD337F|nr:hypothetical protein [Cellulophaga sp. Z1A5H]
MKTLLLTLIFCIFNLNSVEIIGKYQIENKLSYDTLELKKDGTYEYQSRGDSCWTWSDIIGTWELKDRILILNHNYSYEEDVTKYIEKKDSVSKSFVIFEIKDIYGKPISEFEIKYWCENDNTQIKKTDKKGIAKFDKCDLIKNEDDTVGIGIKYLTNGKETTETTSVYKNSDRVILSINSKPKTIDKKEKYRFSFDKGKLKSIEFPYVDEISTYKKL